MTPKLRLLTANNHNRTSINKKNGINNNSILIMCQALAQGCTFIFSFYSCEPGKEALVARGTEFCYVPLASIMWVISVQL